MGYTFTFDDIIPICQRLGMKPVRKGSRTWRGVGPDGKLRQTYIHPHGQGRLVASGTAKAIAKQLGFGSVEEMYRFLHGGQSKTE